MRLLFPRSINESVLGRFVPSVACFPVLRTRAHILLRSASEGAFAGLERAVARGAREGTKRRKRQRDARLLQDLRRLRKTTKRPSGSPAPQGAYLSFIAYLFLTYLGL